MPDLPETLPNYESQPGSPELKDVGLAVALVDAPHRLGSPIKLRGAYVLDDKLARQFPEALLNTLVIVVRCDKTLGRIRRIIEGHNAPPKPPPAAEPVDPSVRSGGYFNLDLAAFSGLIDEPGRYWVLAALGHLVSNRLEFEVIAGSLTRNNVNFPD